MPETATSSVYITQEYSNHDAILFQVYVRGDLIFLLERPSL